MAQLDKLEKKVEVLEEDLSAKFNQSFVEIDAIRFDLNEVQRRLRERNGITGIERDDFTDHSGA